MTSQPTNGNTPVAVFYSYSQKDEELRDQLEEQLAILSRNDLISEWHDRKIEPSADWAGELDSRLESADLILLLVSSSFLASDYCYDVEMVRALERHRGDEARVLPIILRPCMWQESPFANLQAVPKNGLPITSWEDQDAAFLNVAQAIKHAAEEIRVTRTSHAGTTTALGKVWNMPPKNQLFTGRDDVLTEIHEAFQTNNTQAVIGLGGIGKTQTAIEYAHRFRGEYRFGFWANAAEPATLDEGFRDIARLARVPHDSKDPIATRESVRRWLQRNATWLLVFDNADELDELRAYMPREPRGHVLITTRHPVYADFGVAERLTLHPMPVDEAKRLLLRRTGRNDFDDTERQAAEQLVVELGGLPLAIAQAGAYIERTPGSRIDDYLQSFLNRRLELFRGGGRGERESVTTTWSLNFAALDRFPASKDLLFVSAFLAPDAIPFDLITDGASELGPHISSHLADVEDDPLCFNETLRNLAEFSLVNVFHADRTYSIHRLVGEVVRAALPSYESRRTWVERAVRAANRALPEVEYPNWARCERLLPHWLALAELASEYHLENEEAGQLLDSAASYLQDRGQFQAAEPLYRQALEIRRAALGEEHPDFATTLNNLARLYQTMGRYEAAEPLYRQALEILRASLGEEHPSFATTLDSLAGFYWAMGRYEAAEPLCRQALEIRRAALGEEHPDFAATVHNLAGLYWAMGRYEAAEPLFRQAQEIRRAALGEEHPDFATTLHNLGRLYQAMGRYEAAELLRRQALEIRRVALGEEHPSFATTLNNLAGLYRVMGRDEAAGPLYRKALEIRRAALGEQHPHFANTRDNLAALREEMGGSTQ